MEGGGGRVSVFSLWWSVVMFCAIRGTGLLLSVFAFAFVIIFSLFCLVSFFLCSYLAFLSSLLLSFLFFIYFL